MVPPSLDPNHPPQARLRQEQRQQARQELKQLRDLRRQETEAMYERHRQRAVWSTAFPPGPAGEGRVAGGGGKAERGKDWFEGWMERGKEE